MRRERSFHRRAYKTGWLRPVEHAIERRTAIIDVFLLRTPLMYEQAAFKCEAPFLLSIPFFTVYVAQRLLRS